MVKITWKDNPYNAIRKIVTDKYKNRGESIVVQLRTKYSCEDEYEEHTELLMNDGDWMNPDYCWENDWWEGKDDIILVAAAPISEIELDKKWRITDDCH